jgi:hypothetical protein
VLFENPLVHKANQKNAKWYINTTQFGNVFTTKMMFNFTIWQILPKSFNGDRTMANKKLCTTTKYFSNIT